MYVCIDLQSDEQVAHNGRGEDGLLGALLGHGDALDRFAGVEALCRRRPRRLLKKKQVTHTNDKNKVSPPVLPPLSACPQKCVLGAGLAQPAPTDKRHARRHTHARTQNEQRRNER